MNKDEVIRAEVIRAARGLFQRYGLIKTTMEEIARAAGKGKSSLYYYYSNKDEIFDSVVQEDMAETFGMVKAAVEKAPTAEGKLKAFSSTKIKALSQKVSLYGIVFGEIADNPQLIKRLKQRYEALEMELLRTILAFGMETGEFKRVDDENLDDLTYIMLSAFRGIEMGLLEDNRIKKMGDRLEIILDVLSNGIKR